MFTTVCDAIQHAHQKGIIYRDIKPSNVLITQIGSKPVVKVIDFGLAKATSGQRLSEKSVYTDFMRLMGTPLYMSPEQAGLSGLDVDTRSDIYSLGILLYELLKVLKIQSDPVKPLATHPVFFRANKEAIPFTATDDLSLAAYGFMRNIYVIDLATGQEIWRGMASQRSPVMALQFSPNGEMLASSAGYRDSNIILWDCRSGDIIQTLQGHRGWVGDLVWANGKTLASCSTDQTICLWDLSDFENVPLPRKLVGHADEVWRLTLLADGETLVSGSRDGVLMKWDRSVASTRAERIELPLQSVAFGISARRRSIITADSQGAVTELSGHEFQHTTPRLHTNRILNANGAVFWLSENDELLRKANMRRASGLAGATVIGMATNDSIPVISSLRFRVEATKRVHVRWPRSPSHPDIC